MKLRKTLSILLTICMTLSSVSVAFAEDTPVSTDVLEIAEESVEKETSGLKIETVTEETAVSADALVNTQETAEKETSEEKSENNT